MQLKLFDIRPLKKKLESTTFRGSDFFTNIINLINLVLDGEDNYKLQSFFIERLTKYNQGQIVPNDKEFCSQELINFSAKEKIYFYLHFDYKSESINLDTKIRKKLEKHFDISFHSNLCDLNDPNFDMVHKINKIYGDYLYSKYDIILCNVCYRTTTDYHIFLIKNEDYDYFNSIIQNLGFTVTHYSENWLHCNYTLMS